MTSWITWFMAPVGFAVFALVLPQRLDQSRLILVWSAAILLGSGTVASFLGASAAAMIMLPASIITLVAAIKMMRKQPKPRPNGLWLIASAILSGAFAFAMLMYATPWQ